jgi:hypothetical protein
LFSHTEDDVSHIRDVEGYVHRHQAQDPENEDIENSRWGYALINFPNATRY